MPRFPSAVKQNSDKNQPRQRRSRLRTQQQNAQICYPYHLTRQRNYQNRKRRQLKQQVALNLEECYDQCQYNGFHFDPDVAVGSCVNREANRFSVLQDQTDFSFRVPTSWASYEGTTALNTPTHDEDDEERVPHHAGQLQPMSPEVQSTSIPLPPQTPPSKSAYSRLKIKIPANNIEFGQGNHDQHRSSTALTYSRGHEIPSPLLYHRRKSETSADRQDSIGGCRLPDATSHRGDLRTAEAANNEIEARGEANSVSVFHYGDDNFIAAALPLMGEALRCRTTIEDLSQHVCAFLSKHMSLTSLTCPILTTTNVYKIGEGRSEHQEPRSSYVDPFWNGVLPDKSTRCFNTDHDLIFPKLPESFCEDQDSVWNLWLNFEQSMQDSHVTKFEDKLAGQNNLECSALEGQETNFDANLGVTGSTNVAMEVAVCATPSCQALVPAWPYGYRLDTWRGTVLDSPLPPALHTTPNVPVIQPTLAMTTNIIDCLAEDLGLDREHAEDCCFAFQAGDTSIGTDSATESGAPIHANSGHRLQSESSFTSESSVWYDTRAGLGEDEGYWSGRDSLTGLTEIEAEEADTGNEDWEDFEWTSEDEVEEEAMGLHATTWEGEA